MQLFEFIVSLILLVAGCALLYFFALVIFSQLRGSGVRFSGGSMRGKMRVKKSAVRVQRADDYIGGQQYLQAVKELRKALIFDAVSSHDIIRVVREHHQNILSRFLVIAEEVGSRIDNIADIERLFLERSELDSLLLKATSSFDKLKSKREQDGKDMPSWGKDDFVRRISEIKESRAENLKGLEKELDRMVDRIKTPQGDSITYH